MGKAHTKLLPISDNLDHPGSHRRPEDQGGAVMTGYSQEVPSGLAAGGGDNQAKAEDCNGSPSTVKPDHSTNGGSLKHSHSERKGKKLFKWAHRRHSHKEASKEHKEKKASQAKELDDSKQDSPINDTTTAEKTVVQETSLVDDVMTSAVVAHAEEVAASTTTSACQAAPQSHQPETVPVGDAHQTSKSMDHEQSPVESAVQPTEQDNPPKAKRRVEIIHVNSRNSEAQGSDEDECHAGDQKTDAAHHSPRHDHVEDYVPVDTNNTNVHGDETVHEVHKESVNQVKEETVNGVHEEAAHGVHKEAVNEVHESTVNGMSKDHHTTKLAGSELADVPAHEVTVSSHDHEKELSHEPVI